MDCITATVTATAMAIATKMARLIIQVFGQQTHRGLVQKAILHPAQMIFISFKRAISTQQKTVMYKMVPPQNSYHTVMISRTIR